MCCTILFSCLVLSMALKYGVAHMLLMFVFSFIAENGYKITLCCQKTLITQINFFTMYIFIQYQT